MIRKATLNDFDTLVLFNILLAKETEDLALDPATVQAGVRAVFEDSSKGCYWVLERDNKVVSQLLITYEWSDWRCRNWWWIQSVYTDIDYRKQGSFTQLYEFIKKLVEEEKTACGIRLTVDRLNLRARQTYLRLGMHHSHYDLFEYPKGAF
jgi:GNAT superfamily N-acetyltransferase